MSNNNLQDITELRHLPLIEIGYLYGLCALIFLFIVISKYRSLKKLHSRRSTPLKITPQELENKSIREQILYLEKAFDSALPQRIYHLYDTALFGNGQAPQPQIICDYLNGFRGL